MPVRIRAVATAAAAAAIAAVAGPAAAVSYECAGPGTSLSVVVEPAAGLCEVDGTRASLRKPHDPVVCHVSTPQLRILSIETDSSFRWEDTDSDRIVSGTCTES
jgi:hypothetical protein